MEVRQEQLVVLTGNLLQPEVYFRVEWEAEEAEALNLVLSVAKVEMVLYLVVEEVEAEEESTLRLTLGLVVTVGQDK